MGFPLTKIGLEPRTVLWGCKREEGGERGEIYSNGQWAEIDSPLLPLRIGLE